MIATFVARALTLAGLLACAALAHGQSLELVTGAGRYVDAPGTTVPTRPLFLAMAPDGRLYIADPNGNLQRYDPATGGVTALPANDASINLGVTLRARGFSSALAIDSAGHLYLQNAGRLLNIDPDAGTLTDVGPFPGSEQAVFGPDGTLYYGNGGRVFARSPSGNIVPIAGTGTQGFSGDGGLALNAQIGTVFGIARANNGDLYITESNYHRIRKISAASGVITTIAGTGNFVFNGDGQPALQTNFNQPIALALDPAGNLYVAGQSNYRIQRIDAVTGIVTTVAGTGQSGLTGDGGPATAARILIAREMQFDSSGNLYFADGGFDQGIVRRIAADTGIVTRVIGNLSAMGYCGTGVPARAACLASISGLDIVGGNDLVIADSSLRGLFRVPGGNGQFTTVASAPELYIFGVDHDAAGNLYTAMWDNFRVVRIDSSGVVTYIAGNGTLGFSGDGGPATMASISGVQDVAIDAAGNVYFADGSNNRVRRVDAATGIISTYAGGGTGGPGDGGPATNAFINGASRIEFDPAGNLVIGESFGCRIRRVDAATGIISTIVGTGTCTTTPPAGGLAATATPISNVSPFTFDSDGNLYLPYGSRIFRVDAVTGILDPTPGPVAGLTTPDGIGFNRPTALEFDAQGRLYVVDGARPYVFRITGLLDSTPPAISPAVTGTLGNDGWYRSDAQVSWSVVDEDSGIVSSTGCSSTVVSEDTSGLTLTCSATSGGGTASSGVTIKRDGTPPTLAWSAMDPPADAEGWHNGDVTFSFTASDALSGLESTSQPSPVVVGQPGVGVVRAVTAVDVAGNSATFSTDAVNIDRTPPVIQAGISGTAGNGGWYTSDVGLEWTINEYPTSLRSSTGCEGQLLSVDTAGVVFTCSAVSAGGTHAESVNLKRDATPPVLTFGAASPAPNAAGWIKGNVSVPFTRTDALSGIGAASATSPLVLSAQGAGVTGQVTVSDAAGNSAAFTTPAFNIDNAAPVVALTAPAQGVTYGFYQDLPAQFTCTDVSLKSCVGTVAAGALVNTRTAGTRTFTVTAKDQVNYTTAVTNTFTVMSFFNLEGFLAPMSAAPTLNAVTRGSLVPIRWRLPDGHGGFVSNTASFVSATVSTISCSGAPTAPFNDVATGPAGIGFDPATSAFTYHWQTNAGWTGCRKVVIKLKDNSTYEARFRLQ